jgi:hypothetical protein
VTSKIILLAWIILHEPVNSSFSRYSIVGRAFVRPIDRKSHQLLIHSKKHSSSSQHQGDAVLYRIPSGNLASNTFFRNRAIQMRCQTFYWGFCPSKGLGIKPASYCRLEQTSCFVHHKTRYKRAVTKNTEWYSGLSFSTVGAGVTPGVLKPGLAGSP